MIKLGLIKFEGRQIFTLKQNNEFPDYEQMLAYIDRVIKPDYYTDEEITSWTQGLSLGSIRLNI